MESTLGKTLDVELSLRSFAKASKATDPIFRRVEELWDFLGSLTEMESTGNSEAFCLRRDRDFSSHSRNWNDIATGVQMNSYRRTRLQNATTMDNFTICDQKQCESDDNKSHMTQLMNVTTYVPSMIQRNIYQHKMLQTRRPTFKGQKERYNEFEHLLLNHIRPFQNKITDEENFIFFTSLLREDAVEIWQTIRVTPDTTLRYVI